MEDGLGIRRQMQSDAYCLPRKWGCGSLLLLTLQSFPHRALDRRLQLHSCGRLRPSSWVVKVTSVSLSILSAWQLQKRCNLLRSLWTADDTGFPFNKLEEFWIMEQSNHLIINLFNNRLLEFVVIKSFLILLKIIFNILHHLNFPISAETTSAPSDKSLA